MIKFPTFLKSVTDFVVWLIISLLKHTCAVDACAVEVLVYNMWLDDFDLYQQNCPIIIIRLNLW